MFKSFYCEIVTHSYMDFSLQMKAKITFKKFMFQRSEMALVFDEGHTLFVDTGMRKF